MFLLFARACYKSCTLMLYSYSCIKKFCNLVNSLNRPKFSIGMFVFSLTEIMTPDNPKLLVSALLRRLLSYKNANPLLRSVTGLPLIYRDWSGRHKPSTTVPFGMIVILPNLGEAQFLIEDTPTTAGCFINCASNQTFHTANQHACFYN